MLEAVVTVLGTALFGVVGWAFQLSNRVSVVEVQRADLEKLINARFDDMARRLGRIERGMNGHLSGIE